jgi:hypothetical protein
LRCNTGDDRPTLAQSLSGGNVTIHLEGCGQLFKISQPVMCEHRLSFLRTLGVCSRPGAVDIIVTVEGNLVALSRASRTCDFELLQAEYTSHRLLTSRFGEFAVKQLLFQVLRGHYVILTCLIDCLSKSLPQSLRKGICSSLWLSSSFRQRRPNIACIINGE